MSTDQTERRDEQQPTEVVLEVHLRPEHVQLMRAFAAREGAPVEALAALWIEEKLDEALRVLGRPGGG